MSKKRFERIYGHKELVCKDNRKSGKEKFFNNSDKDYNKFVNALNDLSDKNDELQMENIQLKEELCSVSNGYWWFKEKTEKRFTIADYPTDIIDNKTGEKYPCSSYFTHIEGLCDLLNKLDVESELAKEKAAYYKLLLMSLKENAKKITKIFKE